MVKKRKKHKVPTMGKYKKTRHDYKDILKKFKTPPPPKDAFKKTSKSIEDLKAEEQKKREEYAKLLKQAREEQKRATEFYKKGHKRTRGDYIDFLNPFKTKKKYAKGKRLHREVLLGLIALIVVLAVTTTAFFLLWTYFKIGFVWVMAFLAIFITRKTDAWKMGIELHYPLTFIFSYIFGLYFALPLIYLVMAAVVKVRPDELNGAVVHIIICTTMAIIASHLSSIFGLNVSMEQFTFLMMGTIIPLIFVDYGITLKIAPVHWFKALLNHFLDILVSYLVIKWAGYPLLVYLSTAA